VGQDTAPVLDAPAMVTPTPRCISWYLVGAGAGNGLPWVASRSDAFDDRLFTHTGTPTVGNIPIFHVRAEAVMAATALTAGILRRRGSRYAFMATMLANGMLVYSAVNSPGRLLHNPPAVTSLTAVTRLGALASTWIVIRAERPVPGGES